MAGKFEQLAKDLARAWKTGATVALPPKGQGPASRHEAYAIQDRMAELEGRLDFAERVLARQRDAESLRLPGS